MNTQMLAKAVRASAEALTKSDDLRDDAELLRVLARLIEGKSLVQAFGAPGDWGYSHPIGKALAAVPQP